MPRLRGFRSPLQVRHTSFDILYLDGLGRVVQHAIGRPYFDGRWRVRIDHRLQQSGGQPPRCRAMDWLNEARRASCAQIDASSRRALLVKPMRSFCNGFRKNFIQIASDDCLVFLVKFQATTTFANGWPRSKSRVEHSLSLERTSGGCFCRFYLASIFTVMT